MPRERRSNSEILHLKQTEQNPKQMLSKVLEGKNSKSNTYEKSQFRMIVLAQTRVYVTVRKTHWLSYSVGKNVFAKQNMKTIRNGLKLT